MRARCRNASCPASTFAGSPPQASSADAWSARPYENESGQGPPTLLIAFRFSVASTSDWPPDRNTIPGTFAGTCRRKQSTVSSAICGAVALRRAALAGDDHVRFEEHPLQRDALAVELLEDEVERARRHLVAALDRVVGVHQHLGLDDRDDPRLLRERGVTRERVRVHVEARVGRDPVPDRDHRAPLAEARPERVVLREAGAEAVEALRHLLAGVAGQVVGAGVDLDPGHDALRGEHLGERRAVVRRLPDRLVVEDHAADVVLEARRREEEVAVGPPVLLGRLDDRSSRTAS